MPPMLRHQTTVAPPWHDAERRRLVRLCTALTGDPAAAEDLAQETLLEAWRNVHKLHDPAGADRWLSAIARNVCLRWARRRGRDAALLARVGPDAAGDARGVELDLERSELVELLDRALALLPADAREALAQRYVHERRPAEIADELGISEDAVSMRLSRGKALLRRVLAADLREHAQAYGLVDATDGGWNPTRIWCSDCGSRKLLTRRHAAPGLVSFRCPGCNPGGIGSEFPLANPFFARLAGEVIRPTAVLARAAEWSRRYFAPGAGGAAECTRCARPLRLRRYFRDRDGWTRDGLYADCAACGEQVSSSARGLASALPEVRELRRRHPRTRAVPERNASFAGAPAIVVRYEALLGSSSVSVFFSRATLRVLDVVTG